VLAQYFYQPGVDQPVSRTDGSGTVYYLRDHAGSVSALADGSGAILGRYHIQPVGGGGEPGPGAAPTAFGLDGAGAGRDGAVHPAGAVLPSRRRAVQDIACQTACPHVGQACGSTAREGPDCERRNDLSGWRAGVDP
jgi:hypothetical protein